MANPFVETRFDPGIIPKGIGGIIYKTTIIRTGFDFEKRNIARAEWLFEGDIGEVLLDERQVAYIIAFFNARKGKAEGFRYKYWGDYQCTHEPLQLNPKIIDPNATLPLSPTPTINTITQGVLAPIPGSSALQLQKKYVDGGDTTYKTITKPVPGTVKIYAGGNQLGATIDYTTGRASSFSGNNPTSWEGEFDLLVWFVSIPNRDLG